MLYGSSGPQKSSTNQKNEEPTVKPENKRKEISLPKKPAAKVDNASRQDTDKRIMTQLNTLKIEKGELLSQVSNKITSYRNTIKNITNVSKLESEFDKCFSKNEIKVNVTDEEKEELKKNYEQVKQDVEEYEKLQTNLTQGEVWKSEAYADGNNTDEARYTDFNDKFGKVKQEFQNISTKQSDIIFYQSLLKVKNQLTDNTQHCSFKDIIKMNDKLGE